jgi:ATP-dependent Lon protease
MELYETLPIVPLRDVVVFPHMMMPFVIGRPSSTRALEHALLKDKRIFLAAQHDAQTDDPQPNDIYTMGCVASIVQSLKLPDGNIKVLVEGVERARAVEWKEDKGFYRVVVKVIPRPKESGADAESDDDARGVALRAVREAVEQPALRRDDCRRPRGRSRQARRHDLGPPARGRGREAEPARDHLPVERLNRIAGILEAEVDKLQVDRRIQSRVKKQMEKAQKEYYLNEKMKAIQKELGRKDEKGNEIDELKKKIDQAKMPEEVAEKAVQELKRLESMPPMSAEATVSRNYLDWLIAVPWFKKSKESRDLKRAEQILNEDHYGLEKIKDRILEFLAVRALIKKPKATILTFSGPPGVGKTSLAKSIARAMNRKFVRLSLGGVRDEAEIRGHRRTYIGAFPGPDHPDDEEGRDDEPGLPPRRSGQDVDGLPRRPVGGAARGARPRSRTTPSSITTSTSSTTCRT